MEQSHADSKINKQCYNNLLLMQSIFVFRSIDTHFVYVNVEFKFRLVCFLFFILLVFSREGATDAFAIEHESVSIDCTYSHSMSVGLESLKSM